MGLGPGAEGMLGFAQAAVKEVGQPAGRPASRDVLAVLHFNESSGSLQAQAYSASLDWHSHCTGGLGISCLVLVGREGAGQPASCIVLPCFGFRPRWQKQGAYSGLLLPMAADCCARQPSNALHAQCRAHWA
jgi:hypothetical protein